MHDRSAGAGVRETGHSSLERPGYLPLVSIIVVNFNYAAFLREAVESAIAQTYPRIECLVVDDRSTDDSATVIRALADEFPQLKVVLNDENLGQSGSIARGVDASSGHYCVFLDADDFLLPTCVETHVRAHLSLRDHVGLTSGDMLQIFRGEAVTIGSPGFASYVAKAVRPRTKDVRPADLDADWSPSPDMPRGLAEDLYYVPPQDAGGWPWSPTSGNCFRRDALELILRNKDLPTLRSCTDCYLLRGIACLTGSVLIDRPLAGYRLHEKNEFTKGGMVDRFVHYDPTALVERSNFATKMLIDFLICEAPNLARSMESRTYLCDAIDALDSVYPPMEPEPVNAYINTKLIAERTRLIDALGRDRFIDWLSRRMAAQHRPSAPDSSPIGDALRSLTAARLRARFRKGDFKQPEKPA